MVKFYYNFRQIFSLIDKNIEKKIEPIISAYKKPEKLIKKMYENARRSSYKKKILEPVEINQNNYKKQKFFKK